MRDRRRYLHWVFEAKKRFGLCVLNYVVTCNHVHLLVKDTGRNAIATHCRPHGARIQSTQKSPGSVLGRSLSCNRCGSRRTSASFPGVHRLKHGSSRRGQPSHTMEVRRLSCDSGAPQALRAHRSARFSSVVWVCGCERVAKRTSSMDRANTGERHGFTRLEVWLLLRKLRPSSVAKRAASGS
jgi:hypothetical protein